MKPPDTPGITKARNELRLASNNQERAVARHVKARELLREALIKSSPVQPGDVISFRDYAGRPVTGKVSTLSTNHDLTEITINARGEPILPAYPYGKSYPHVQEFEVVKRAFRYGSSSPTPAPSEPPPAMPELTSEVSEPPTLEEKKVIGQLMLEGLLGALPQGSRRKAGEPTKPKRAPSSRAGARTARKAKTPASEAPMPPAEPARKSRSPRARKPTLTSGVSQ